MSDNDEGTVTDPISELPGYGNAGNLMGTPREGVVVRIDPQALARPMAEMLTAMDELGPLFQTVTGVPVTQVATFMACWDTLTGVDPDNKRSAVKDPTLATEVRAAITAVVDGTATIVLVDPS